MTIEKITLNIYHPEVQEFIEKGWLIFKEDLKDLSFLEEHIDTTLKIFYTCLQIQGIFTQALPSEKIYSDILLAAAFFCHLYQHHSKASNCPEYEHIIAIGELENLTLGPNQIPTFQTKWWFPFKKCLLYCKGSQNPLKMLNFDKPVSDLDVIFLIGYQLFLQKQGH